MSSVHFLFPSTIPEATAVDNYGGCGCEGISDEPTNCNEFEEEEPKINSEIVETGEPYKEIEITINDNRMVLRLQRLPVTQKEEYEPPCECLPGSTPQKTESKSPESPEKMMSTMPLPPRQDEKNLKNSKTEKIGCHAIDLADNPNMFLLKIRRRSETSDRRRENLDLEFRTPRPWLPKKIMSRKK